MKLTGALLCVTACALFAFLRLNEERRKLKTCCCLAETLKIIKSELSARLLPLPELTALAVKVSDGSVRDFFRSVSSGFDEIGEKDFNSIWDEAAEKNLPWLTDEQSRQLRFPGSVLGKSVSEAQSAALESSAAFFSEEAARLRERLPAAGKLTVGLSVCAGILIVIMFC